ncbi:MAG: sigma-70 family RNA polymerase sigma factor [Clostridia bacterium]|nr:sigma-70 family RNA polymerase sigma factor [Clostridia bacterium]
MDKKVKRVNSLIVRIAYGDVSALDDLFTEVGGLLYVIARRYLFDKSLADDVVSRVFVKIVKASLNFDADKNGLNWLIKSTKNEALNENVRSGKYLPEPDENHNVADVVTEEDLASRYDVAEALKKLDEKENLLIKYVYWEGLTLREAAEKLAMPLTSTHRLLKNTLKKLGGFLEEKSDS